MRRAVMAVGGATLLMAGSAGPALAAGGITPAKKKTTQKKSAPAPKKHDFTTVEAGNRLSTSGPRFEDIYRVTSSPFGEGSVIRDAGLKTTAFPATGTDTAKTFDRGGRTFAKETFSLGTPNTDGLGTISGDGTCTSGTGSHFGETCTYSFKGTYDLITGITRLTLTGTYTLGSRSKPTK